MLCRNCNYIIVFKVSFIDYLTYYLTLALGFFLVFFVVVFAITNLHFTSFFVCPTVLKFGLNFCFK